MDSLTTILLNSSHMCACLMAVNEYKNAGGNKEQKHDNTKSGLSTLLVFLCFSHLLRSSLHLHHRLLDVVVDAV